jgi:SNF2 family DNA or RNA helicase
LKRSFKIFKENHLSSDDPDGVDKLIARLSQFMCRRTHRDQLFDARLLVLPTPSQEKEWIDFNPVERAVYDIVKARFIKRINGMSSDGELDKKYSFIWTMLLKLRQLCSHILLIQTTLADLLHLEDFERLRTISNDDLSDDCEELLVHLTRTLKDREGVKKVDATDGNIALTETENVPIDRINHEPTDSDLGGQHGLSYNFGRYLDSLKDSESFEEICRRALCNGCRQPSEDPHVLSCFHIYCKLCLHDLQISSARKGLDRHRCSECGAHYTDAKPCEKELKPYTEGQDDITGGSRDTGNGEQEPEKKPEAENWTMMKGPILPSAKTIALKARILTWIKEDPDVKIIVYSAFIPMLHLLGRICRTENWKAEKYTGSMSHDSRRKALSTFADPDQGVRILLASLTCGGIGLNLTCASRVISLDRKFSLQITRQYRY